MAKVIRPRGFAAPLGMYSHGMVASGELVIVAGQVGVDANGHVPPDAQMQTELALENVRAVVEAGGASMRDVVRLQTFLTRAEDIADFMKARERVFPRYFPDGAYPPNTLLVVSRLVRPEFLVEIEAIAARQARRAAPAKAPARTGGRAKPSRRRARR